MRQACLHRQHCVVLLLCLKLLQCYQHLLLVALVVAWLVWQELVLNQHVWMVLTFPPVQEMAEVLLLLPQELLAPGVRLCLTQWQWAGV